jgi:glyoxylase I family protein
LQGKKKHQCLCAGAFVVRSPAHDIGNHSNVSTVSQEAAVPEFPPIAHVAVTVTDLARSTRWYGELLAAEPVLDEDEQTGNFHHTVFALGGGQLFGLHAHPGAAGDRFDEYRTGLDHVAFACHDRGELQTWAARLDELGIAHGGIVDAHYGSGVSFRDPDGIALEFFAPPA